jgi:uncharacterized protein YcfL
MRRFSTRDQYASGLGPPQQQPKRGQFMNAKLKVAVVAVAVLALAGCSSSTAGPSKPVKLAVKTSATTTLLWTHIGTAFDEPQASYVVHLTNPGIVPVSVTLNVNAFDSSGTIVGSDQQTVSSGVHESLDCYGQLGGTASSQLTSKPAKVQITAVTGAQSEAATPFLQTSQLTLSPGKTEESFTNAPYAYNMTVRVTNSTGRTSTSGVTQQVILYDTAGHIVGGGTGSSDNVPASLPAGASYREQWTGISAQQPAAPARFMVWVPQA